MEKEIKLTPLYYDYIYGAKYDAIVEIGGRYSSKSYNSQIEEAANLASKKDYKLLIIQELDKGASDGYYAGLIDKLEQFEHIQAYNVTTSSTKITNNINGNSVLFRGYKTEQQKKDVKNIDQVTKIVVEEGEWMTFDDFLSLIQQLRGKVIEDRRLDILMNPVNEYCFANTDLVQPKPDKILEYFPNTNRPKVFERHFNIDSENEKGLSIKVLVVLSTYHDNNYLTDIQKASIEIYRTTDPDKYKQLGEARFIKSGNTFFHEFNKQIHTIKPREIPEHWDRYCSIDYGLDMLAALWYAVDEYGKMYLYREYNQSDLIISEAAKILLEISKNDNIKTYFAPGDLWNRRQETGKSAWEIFKENGLYLWKSDRNRVNGALSIKEWLHIYDTKDEQTGEAIQSSDLKIFNTCPEIIHHLSAILTDDKNPNCYATEPHYLTHNVDSLRYQLIMKTAPSKQIDTKPKRDSIQESYAESVSNWNNYY